MLHSKISSFKTAYTILILSAILAFTSGEVYFYYSMNEQQGNYTLIELTGQQKTNSFLITNLLFNPISNKIDVKSIDSLINCINKIHTTLSTGDDKLEIPPIEKMVLPSYDSLEFALKQYIKAIKLTEISPIETNRKILFQNQNQFIVCIDAMILCFQNDNSNDYKSFRHISWIINLSGVLILLIEVFLIFIPMIKSIRQHDAKMTKIAFNQSHIIRHPLTNIIGLLRLIEKSKMDNAKQSKLIELCESEAQKLDDVLKENMKTIYTNKFDNVE